MSADVKVAAQDEGGNKIAAFVRREIGRVAALASLIIIFTFFAIMRPVFASWANVSGGILMSTTVIGLLAIGVTFVIITGGIDLSVGTSMALTGVIVGKTVMAYDLNVWAGILLGMVVGAALGSVNGILVTVFRLPPFIATLATMKGAQGLALIVSDLKPILFATDVKGWDEIAQGNIIPNFPNGVLILFVAAIVGSIILNKTVLGRYNFAIGSNLEATKLSGVKVRRWLIAIYALCGVYVGLAAVVLTSRLGSAQPDLGLGYELEAIAAVIIGGTSLFGGKGTIGGTIIGALIMSVLINGLRILELQQEWQYVVVGAVILFAVYSDNLRRRRAGDTTV
jgi:ribose transport system permease protein|uniref:ABC transporter permease n=1 Tax=Candidatus Planktophila sp. TaxID=2175601 RepID=UPI00404A6D28